MALKNIDENDYRVYVLGEWGILTDRLVFRNFKECDSIPEHAKKLPSGLDWGFANDPTALIDVYILGDEIYLDERIYQTGLTNLETDNALQESIQKKFKELGVGKDSYIVADSSEPKSITELRNQGYMIYGVKKYPGSIKDGIKLMKAYTINITKRSRNLINEFENYVMKVDKNDNILPQPIDAYNHGIDAVRYVILMKGRLWS
jgi:phage terminase large subunit